MKTKSTWRLGGLALVIISGAGLVTGEEPVTVRKPDAAGVVSAAENPDYPLKRAAKDLWLGIAVSKPEAAVQAQLREIPNGVGFVVGEVAKGGPAEGTGLREYDFVWKMNDQLLVNAAQFWTLLNLQNAGDKVTLTIQRGGENQEVELSLEQRPEDQKGRELADTQVMSPPIPGLPTQRYDLLGRVAELRDEQGTVRMWRTGEGFSWAEYDKFELKMRSGELVGAGEEALPPDLEKTLRAKLEALMRGYEQAERNHQASGRGPRVRRVPSEKDSR
ncbi:MAG: PDZ domain-containing protein [Verrucomicrobia bacterium]|nr:PDZ domain-containing protein [Verrucomicrobiota bacterium]